MNQRTFTLSFLVPRALAEDEILQRLADAGCTDALAGLGVPGRLGLEFTRAAPTRAAAVTSALRDVLGALPGAHWIG